MENSEMEEFINEVRDRSDIQEVVSRYVPLNLRNGRFWACCPFHEEKTPSFSITPEKGIFYCFGCHAGGNVFKFISLIEHITYFEAVKLQAERLGIKIPSRKKTSTEIKIEQEKDLLLRVTSEARDFYHNFLLKSNDAEQGRKYLAARGISDEVIKSFKIGFAPAAWHALTDKLKAQGFNEKQIVTAGLAIERKNNNGVFDRLRDRVIIPISDAAGRVVAFGGRILTESENQPKYLNTPETEIFVKGKMLFGLEKSSRAIISANTAIIVEGYMDVISLYSAGIENVVASLGTAFTEDHAKILSRYARRIIFCYDSDDAGQRATIRALPMMKNTGVEVFVLIIPDGKDPDEFIRKHGKDAFERLLKNVKPIIEYQFQYKTKNIDESSLSNKIQILHEMFPLCLEIKNSLILEDYFKIFSSRLLLNEDLIKKEWRIFSRRSTNKQQKKVSNSRQKKKTLVYQSGGSIVKTLWENPELLSYVDESIPRNVFEEIHVEIINFIEKCYMEERPPDDLRASEELSVVANAELLKILGANNPNDFQAIAFQDSIENLKKIHLEKCCKKVSQEVSELFKKGDEKSYTEKVVSLLEFQKKLNQL